MIALQLKKSNVPSDEPLQRIGEMEPEAGENPVRSEYLEAFSVNTAPQLFRGWPVVTRIDPAKWPYPPETDYDKEWDEAGK